jgi:hypothetical protein
MAAKLTTAQRTERDNHLRRMRNQTDEEVQSWFSGLTEDQKTTGTVAAYDAYMRYITSGGGITGGHPKALIDG